MSGEHPDQKVIEELVAGIRAQQNGSAVAVVNSHGESPAVGDGPQLTDTQILTKLFSEREGDKWRAVYGEKWGRYYASRSEADSAFLHKLAFYSSDPAQIERIMRGSSLAHAREKWDSRRNGSSWLSLEITRAIENTPERYTPRREDDCVEPYSRSPSSLGMRNDLKRSIQAVSFRGRRKPGPRKWLVERAIWEEHVATWYGAGGIAKSLLAVHLGMTLADPGTPRWAGLEVKTAPVLYGDFELDEDEHLRRSQEIAAGMGLDDVPEHFYYLPLVGLATREAFALAAEECRRLGAKLFVVDSVGFALDGDSELSKDVLKFH